MESSSAGVYKKVEEKCLITGSASRCLGSQSSASRRMAKRMLMSMELRMLRSMEMRMLRSMAESKGGQLCDKVMRRS